MGGPQKNIGKKHIGVKVDRHIDKTKERPKDHRQISLFKIHYTKMQISLKKTKIYLKF